MPTFKIWEPTEADKERLRKLKEPRLLYYTNPKTGKMGTINSKSLGGIGFVDESGKVTTNYGMILDGWGVLCGGMYKDKKSWQNSFIGEGI